MNTLLLIMFAVNIVYVADYRNVRFWWANAIAALFAGFVIIIN
jgi:hypothetical protein